MACNCATSEQIKALYEKYGKKSEDKNNSPKGRLRHYAVVLCGTIIMIPLSLFFVFKGLFLKNKKINISKFFGLKQG